MFFGPVGISLVFNMLFLYRFCRKLEETSFAGNTAGFIIMLLFGASVTVVGTHSLSHPLINASSLI